MKSRELPGGTGRQAVAARSGSRPAPAGEK